MEKYTVTNSSGEEIEIRAWHFDGAIEEYFNYYFNLKEYGDNVDIVDDILEISDGRETKKFKYSYHRTVESSFTEI